MTQINDTYVVQRWTHAGGEAVYQRAMLNSIWSEWRLIAGEEILWSGSIEMGLVNTSLDVTLFGHLEFYTSGGIILIGTVNRTPENKNIKAFANETYDTNCYMYGTTAVLGDKSLNLIRSYSYVIGGAKNTITTIKIVGRP